MKEENYRELSWIIMSWPCIAPLRLKGLCGSGVKLHVSVIHICSGVKCLPFWHMTDVFMWSSLRLLYESNFLLTLDHDLIQTDNRPLTFSLIFWRMEGYNRDARVYAYISKQSVTMTGSAGCPNPNVIGS